MKLHLRVNSAELDTILAGLRLLQEHIDFHVPTNIRKIASEHGEPLTSRQIDELCERINCT